MKKFLERFKPGVAEYCDGSNHPSSPYLSGGSVVTVDWVSLPLLGYLISADIGCVALCLKKLQTLSVCIYIYI